LNIIITNPTVKSSLETYIIKNAIFVKKMKVFLGSNKEEIEIENQPSLGKGGEGEVYKVIAPAKYIGYCVKIYNKNKITTDKIKKLEYLLGHSPIMDSKGHHSVIWVEDIIYIEEKNTKNHIFAGLLMPIAEGYSVEYLCANKFPVNRIKSNETALYRKFERTHQDNLKSRLVVCYNVGVALAQLHYSGLYVHGDIKPENIIFNAKGKISIIDFDSVQVIENGKVLFPALAQTPEYIPPSYQKNLLKNTVLSPFTDVFSITVIFYRILTGIHPFAATNFKAPYHNITDIPTAIEHKLFPFGEKQQYFNQIPPLHQLFRKLPKNLQDLFIQVLEHENTNIKATDWTETIHPQKPKLQFPEISLPKYAFSFKYENLLEYSFEPNPIITLPTYIDGQYDKIHWVEEEQLKPSLMDNLFRPQKARIANEIIYLQNTCQELIYEYKKLKKKHSDMLLKYAAQSKTIAEKSQESYADLLKQYDFASYFTKLDELYHEYRNKIYQELEQWLNQKVEQIPEIKEYLNAHLKELEKLNANQFFMHSQHIHAIKHLMQTQKISFEEAKEKYIISLKNTFQYKITTIEQEIQKLHKNKNSRNWENHPWIQQEIENIYIEDSELPYLIIDQFESAGFRTAADIIDIDEKGQVLNKKGNFVKIPKIGFTRANEVWTWKNEVLKKLKKEAKKQNIDLNHFDTPEILAKKGEIDTLKAELNQLQSQIKSLHADINTVIEHLTAQFWYKVFKTTQTTLEFLIEPTLKKYNETLQKYNLSEAIEKLKNIIDTHNEKQLEIKLYYENTHLACTRQKTEIEAKMQENLAKIKELWKNI
jgi:serine/threonine protein kinase